MNLTNFVDALKEIPHICGWNVAYIKLEESSKENEVHISCDIFYKKADPDSLYTAFWDIIDQVEHLFGTSLIDSEIIENPYVDDRETCPYVLMLTVKYKKNHSSDQIIIEE